MIVLSLTFATRTSRDIALNQGNDLKNAYACEAALSLAKRALMDDARKDQQEATPFDAPSEDWAKEAELDVGGVKAEYVLVDEERKFNINALATDDKRVLKVAKEQFRRLITLFESKDTHLADRIIDFIDLDDKGDYEDNAKNEALQSLDELFAIDGVTDELMDGVPGDPDHPGFVDVLTTISSGRININTAHAFVLRSLSGHVTKEMAEQIIEYREEHPFKTVQDIAKSGARGFPIGQAALVCATTSSFFRLHATATTGALVKHARALLFRDEDGRVFVIEWEEKRW